MNVALSRAKEGMFIFGDASLLSSRNEMWKSITDKLEDEGCLGPGLPISCHQHSDDLSPLIIATRPGDIRLVAPDGKYKFWSTITSPNPIVSSFY